MLPIRALMQGPVAACGRVCRAWNVESHKLALVRSLSFFPHDTLSQTYRHNDGNSFPQHPGSLAPDHSLRSASNRSQNLTRIWRKRESQPQHPARRRRHHPRRGIQRCTWNGCAPRGDRRGRRGAYSSAANAATGHRSREFCPL
jgi:hypothetical protein